MKKFESVAANEKNPKWEQMIKRPKPLIQKEGDIRTPFERDYTRIIYATAYRRMKHKTQVFFSPESDHICTRIEHVNYVESISYTIANALGLNAELTKAIASAHDIGHSPFGHQGERILNEILLRETGERFWHERNGLNVVDNLNLLTNQNDQKDNLNLTYAVRDGIISHCGEVTEDYLKPRDEIIDLSRDYTKPSQYSPYTWEGCVVKLSDKIAYLGRDLEDSLYLKVLKQDQLDELKKLLKMDNMNNSNIIRSLISDLCENSSIEGGLRFSNEKLEFLKKMNEFYIKNVYLNEKVKRASNYFKIIIEEIFEMLYEQYDGAGTIKKLEEKKELYPKLINSFMGWISNYLISNKDGINNKIFDIEDKKDYAKAIVYYISEMTDQYAMDTYNELIMF